MNARNSDMGVSGEEVASHSIRANHELILDLCLAKDALEQINNDLPDLFGVITPEGNIIKGNHAYTKLAGIDDEDVGNSSLKNLFSPESWRILENALKSQVSALDDVVSIEVPIDAINAEALYHWTFSPFRAISERRGLLRSFVGKDITKLRETERKLANIFAAIPLGVLTINRDKKIEWPYSAYTELLLGSKNLDGVSAELGIFGRSKRFMSSSQLEGIQVFLNQIGAEEEWYDMTKEQFPIEIPFAEESDLEPTAWRGLTYNPIVRQGRVEKVLVVVEDITERVRQRLAFSARLTKEQKVAQIIFDLQEADPFMLNASIDDIKSYLAEIGRMVASRETVRSVCNSLHGIKGVARTINLRTFKEFVHEMESRLLRHAPEIDAQGGQRLPGEYAMLMNEWTELMKFVGIFQATIADSTKEDTSRHVSYTDLLKKRNHLIELLEKAKNWLPGHLIEVLNQPMAEARALSCVGLNAITPKVENFFEATAKRIQKEAKIECGWNHSEIDYSKVLMLQEIFYHLITNSLDHGLEAPDQREQAGKSREGLVRINAFEDGELIRFTVEDDGAGLNEDLILEKAKLVGLVKGDHPSKGPQVWNLIITSGFSTSKEVTDTSGRGIGLDAVEERIKKMGGSGLRVTQSIKGKGTTFAFEVRKFE